jgi:hypothetical protein
VLIAIGIAIEIGAIRETFDNDPDPDPDPDFDWEGSIVLNCKNLTHLHRSWPLKHLFRRRGCNALGPGDRIDGPGKTAIVGSRQAVQSPVPMSGRPTGRVYRRRMVGQRLSRS